MPILNLADPMLVVRRFCPVVLDHFLRQPDYGIIRTELSQKLRVIAGAARKRTDLVSPEVPRYNKRNFFRLARIQIELHPCRGAMGRLPNNGRVQFTILRKVLPEFTAVTNGRPRL